MATVVLFRDGQLLHYNLVKTSKIMQFSSVPLKSEILILYVFDPCVTYKMNIDVFHNY